MSHVYIRCRQYTHHKSNVTDNVVLALFRAMIAFLDQGRVHEWLFHPPPFANGSCPKLRLGGRQLAIVSSLWCYSLDTHTPLCIPRLFFPHSVFETTPWRCCCIWRRDHTTITLPFPYSFPDWLLGACHDIHSMKHAYKINVV